MARDLFIRSKDVDATVSGGSNLAESSLQCHAMFARYGGHSKLDGAFITTVNRWFENACNHLVRVQRFGRLRLRSPLCGQRSKIRDSDAMPIFLTYIKGCFHLWL
jgi:hypothetical protein